ncbi:putative bifunctional diguanylate cyclase/phosphodiesterase [Geodermatophilus sp. SYSU D00815]
MSGSTPPGRAAAVRTATGVLAGSTAVAAVELLLPGAAPRLSPAVLAVATWLAAGALARRCRRLPAPARRPWQLLTAVAVLLGAGQALSAVHAAGVNTGVGGVQDLPLVAAVPVAVVACLRMLPPADPVPGFRTRALLDGGIVVLAVVVLAQLLLTDAVAATAIVVEGLISVGYPAVGGVLCGLGLAVVTAVPPGRRPAAVRLLGAFVALTVVAVSGAVAVAHDSTVLDVVTGVAWLGMAGLAVRAAAVDGPAAERGPAEPPRLPLVGVVTSHCTASAVSLAVIAWLVLDRPFPAAGAAEMAVLLVLTLVRSLLWGADARRLTGRLQRAEAHFRALVHSGGDVTVVVDGSGRITWASGDVRDRIGWAEQELIGRFLSSLVHVGDRAAAAGLLAAYRDGGELAQLLPAAVRVYPPRGAWRHVEIASAAPGPHGLVLHVRALGPARRSALELERLAYTDHLTGLPNRPRLLSALEAARDRAGSGAEACVLMIDLDGFKPVNDVAGHDAGDDLLVQVATRLRRTVRDRDLVGRLGGDEFAVLVRSGADEATALAERIVAELRDLRPTAPAGGHGDELVFDVSGSVGVAELDPAEDVATTLRHADLALRAAKLAGKSCVRRYVDTPDDAAGRRAVLARDLPAAIERGQLRLVFQPVVGVAEGRVLGLEALVRWEHPELGTVPPHEFISLAEADGLVVPLQRWVLREATGTVAPLLAEGRDLKLGLNVSIRHLQAGSLAADVARALAESGVPPHRLMVELTESVLMSAEDRFEGDLSTLRDMGVVISLDDFGKGYSSLARLARLPVDVIKMDSAFVGHIVDDPRSAALVGSVVELGRTLGMDVVAEGVETQGQLDALRALGCRFLQGYLLGAPVPSEQLRAVIDGFDADVLRPGAGLTDQALAVH